MAILFVTRRNVHARYYQQLRKHLNLATRLHLMGWPKFSAWAFLAQAFNTNLSQMIETQLIRKTAKQPKLAQLTWLANVYRGWLLIQEKCRLAKYLSLFSQEKPDLLVIWNGKKLPNQTVVLAAQQLSIPIYYFENGLLPGTTTLDPNGVNQAASLPKDPAFYLAQSALVEMDFHAPKIEQRAAHRRRNQHGESALPERFIFVPFQVPHDTQIACYSPWIPDMETFYDAVVKAVKELGDPQLKVVFKEHPTWHKHYTHLYHKDPIAMFANDNVTRDIMMDAEAVITINSTVGLEALLLNKKVITLGQACFNIENLVLHADNQSQLEAHLAALSTWQMDYKLRNAFFNYLQNIYCVPGNGKECDQAHSLAIEKRLTGQDEFAHGAFHADFISLRSLK